MSLNCTISNIQFDYAFNDAIKKASKNVSSDSTTFQNGIPNQTVLVFKTICCLPDEIHTRIISEWTRKLFGVAVSTTSTVRNLHKLDSYGLIDIVDNPLNELTVEVWLDGEFMTNVTTDSSGLFTAIYPVPADAELGPVLLEIRFVGSQFYLPSDANGTWNIFSHIV